MRALHTRTKRITQPWPAVILEELPDGRSRVAYLRDERDWYLCTTVIKPARIREIDPSDRDHHTLKRTEMLADYLARGQEPQFEMETSPPLFPDLLEQIGTPEWRRGIWCIGEYVTRRHGRIKRPGDLHDFRGVTVTWRDQRRYVDPIQPWKLSIVHYRHTWTGEGRKRKHDFRMHSFSRGYPNRASVCDAAAKLLAIIERIEKRRAQERGE